jgi:SAM-dependent methyltransferase
MSQYKTEVDEVASRYARRPSLGMDARYSVLNPEVWLGMQERQRALIDLLSRHANAPLEELRVLEIGCGAGGNVLELIRLGLRPENIVANELLPERATLARRNLPPGCQVVEGNAAALQFSDECFDIVYQSTVFTSLLDADFRRDLASCLWRWVKPGGGVLWYDFIYDNPVNPDVKGVPIRQVRSLFPEGDITVRRVTLAPPISRCVSRLHPFAYHLFNIVPLLRTHVLCWIGKSNSIQ